MQSEANGGLNIDMDTPPTPLPRASSMGECFPVELAHSFFRERLLPFKCALSLGKFTGAHLQKRALVVK